MLYWDVYFKSDQHHKVLKKLCRLLKVDPVNAIFDVSCQRGKTSHCRFEIKLESSRWSDCVAESLLIANRVTPHWRLSMIPSKRLICETDECHVEGVDSVSWDLDMVHGNVDN